MRSNLREFFDRCLSDITPLPRRFDKSDVLGLMMDITSATLHFDKDLRRILLRIASSYPQHPLDYGDARNFVRALGAFSRLYAMRGTKINERYLIGALNSDLPYSLFSDLVLGNYTSSYFFEYRKLATEQHFRANWLFVKSRSGLRSRKKAVESYFEMINPTVEAYRSLTESKCKLWMLITLWNSKNLKEFAQTPDSLMSRKIDGTRLERVTKEYYTNLDKFRTMLFSLNPEVFKPADALDKATRTMWSDLLLLKLSR
jgi:hypothetical protein